MKDEEDIINKPSNFNTSYHQNPIIDNKMKDAKTYGDHLTPYVEKNIIQEGKDDSNNKFVSDFHNSDNLDLKLQAAREQADMFAGERIECVSHNNIVDPTLPKFQTVVPHTNTKGANYDLVIAASHQSHNLDKYVEPRESFAHEGDVGNMNTIYHPKDKFEQIGTGKRIPFTSEVERESKMEEIARPLDFPPLTEKPGFVYLPKVSPVHTSPLNKKKKNKPIKEIKENEITQLPLIIPSQSELIETPILTPISINDEDYDISNTIIVFIIIFF